MENYPGFELIEGMELIDKMKNQTLKYCDINEIEEVEKVKKTNDGYILTTYKDEYFTKAMILSTGASHKHLNVPGENAFIGRGVAYCATCDGLFFKDKNVLMIGGGNTAIQEGLYLKDIGCNVTLVHRRNELRAEATLQNRLNNSDIEIIWNSTVKEIKGDRTVESVILTSDGEDLEVPTDAIFISIGYNPLNQLAKDLGVDIDDKGYIITDKSQRTNVKNIYSAGDITGGIKQWIVACGEGATAAISAYMDLNK